MVVGVLHVILEPVPEESEQRQDNHQTVAHLNVGGAVAEISRTSAHNERGSRRERGSERVSKRVGEKKEGRGGFWGRFFFGARERDRDRRR